MQSQNQNQNRKSNQIEILHGPIQDQSMDLFKPNSWITSIEFINHLTLFNNVLIAVFGEKGSGKSSFFTVLQKNLDEPIKALPLKAIPLCSAQDLYKKLALHLGLPESLPLNLHAISQEINAKKEHILILMDDAQYAPLFFIKEVLEVIKAQGEFGFFHFCLLADYSLEAPLKELASTGSSSLIHLLELGVLNKNETRTYLAKKTFPEPISHCLLTEQELQDFYHHTKGNIAKINAHFRVFCQAQARPKTDKKLLKWTSLLASCALFAVGCYFTFTHMQASPLPESLAVARDSTLLPIYDKSSVIVSTGDNLSRIAFWQDDALRQEVYYATPKNQSLDDVFAEEESTPMIALIDKVLVIPTVKKTKEVLATPELQPLNSQVASIAPLLTSNLATNDSFKKRTIKEVKLGSYTIQLLASRRAGEVHYFKKNNKILKHAQVRHFTDEEGGWYVLTLGQFNTKVNAHQQLKKLPPELSKLNPWVRATKGLSSQVG